MQEGRSRCGARHCREEPGREGELRGLGGSGDEDARTHHGQCRSVQPPDRIEAERAGGGEQRGGSEVEPQVAGARGKERGPRVADAPVMIATMTVESIAMMPTMWWAQMSFLPGMQMPTDDDVTMWATRPHAVTLVRADREADAMLAASRITHFPVNSPTLYVAANRPPPETEAELRRLGPDGDDYDNGVQVYPVGPISRNVEEEARRKIGYETRAFRTADPIQLSEELDDWAAAVHADHPDAVAIVQYERLDTGLPSVAWNAHMGDGLLFVLGDSVPAPTRRALSNRFAGEAFLYLFGDTTVISNRVARELSSYGQVQRVAGRDAAEISVAFAKYRDFGLDQGYWITYRARDFGWGITEAGHNFTFVNPSDWHQAVAGALLSHMGKHGPMLLLPDGRIPEAMRRYLESVHPALGSPSDQLTNHGWVLGGTDRISHVTQGDIDALLDASLGSPVRTSAPPGTAPRQRK